MKLLFENWRQYISEADKPTSHPYPSYLQTIPGAWGKFKTGVDNLIENFQNSEDFISELWKLYKASDTTHLQVSEMMSDIMDKYNLPDDIDDAVLDFSMYLTGRQVYMHGTSLQSLQKIKECNCLEVGTKGTIHAYFDNPDEEAENKEDVIIWYRGRGFKDPPVFIKFITPIQPTQIRGNEVAAVWRLKHLKQLPIEILGENI